MKTRKEEIGSITVPKGMVVLPHELVVATVLSWTGDDVEFIPLRTIKTADIFFRGLEWEIKSPIGKSSRTIENNMRNALKQAKNVIIDLSRIKQNENKAIKEIERQHKLLRGMGKIIIITKTKRVIEL